MIKQLQEPIQQNVSVSSTNADHIECGKRQYAEALESMRIKLLIVRRLEAGAQFIHADARRPRQEIARKRD